MKVVFTRAAEQGLERIGGYIAQDNPVRALSFIRDLRARALALAAHPQAFPLAPRYERYGVRRCVHQDYLIFYRIEDDRVTILLMCHGAQDTGRLLLPDGPP